MSPVVALCLSLPILAAADPGALVLEDFESGKFSWSTRLTMQKERPEYAVVYEDGNHFLRADPSPGVEGNIAYKEKSIEVRKTPILKWRWRARELPKGGDEAVRGHNDCAASIYVYFQTGLRRKILKYTWSTLHKSGEWIESSGNNWFWRTKIRVLKSGPPLNQWFTESVDLERDYREAFHDEIPSQAKGIGVLTDGDQTKSSSQGDYDDFLLVPRGQ